MSDILFIQATATTVWMVTRDESETNVGTVMKWQGHLPSMTLEVRVKDPAKSSKRDVFRASLRRSRDGKWEWMVDGEPFLRLVGSNGEPIGGRFLPGQRRLRGEIAIDGHVPSWDSFRFGDVAEMTFVNALETVYRTLYVVNDEAWRSDATLNGAKLATSSEGVTDFIRAFATERGAASAQAARRAS
jgi:hypothetical protein